jgi:hypothetical protein
MNNEQLAAIERLRELEPSLKELVFYQTKKYPGSLVIETKDGRYFLGLYKSNPGLQEREFIKVLETYNEALPLIEALAAENERLLSENDALRASHDKTHQMIDRIHAALNYKASGFSTLDMANDLHEMKGQIITILDEVLDEDTQESKCVKCEALQARIDGALGELSNDWHSVRVVVRAVEILKGEQSGVN